MTLFIFTYNSEYNTKMISRIYNYFLKWKIRRSTLHYEKWERENNSVLSGESSLIWRELCWKGLVQFFISPQQKLHRTINSDCWRQYQANNADHYHIFWSNPVLAAYQKNIHQTSEEVFSTVVPFFKKYNVLYLCNFPQNTYFKD